METATIPNGNFRIARKLFESKIWLKEPLYIKLWIYLLGEANHSDRERNGLLYKRGEVTTTYDKIIKGLSYYYNREHIVPTLKNVRVMLQWLKSEGMIILKPLRAELPTGADPRAHTGAYLGIKFLFKL